MLLVFVHGWSVTNTDTYGGLPTALANSAPPGLDIKIQHLFLSKYVSFSDEVKVDDIARGMRHAVDTQVLTKLAPGERFACITHSTGGPVVRAWLELFKDKLDQCPLQHLVMLAPANHGSALAQLGKGKLSRMKYFVIDVAKNKSVEPGTGVLDWLELGSEQGWALNKSWLDYKCVDAGLYAFVLTGQTIDHKLYDHLNSYTGEAGSDGVVRVTAANMNYGLIQLEQQDGDFRIEKMETTEGFALGVLPKLAHSGEDIGIMRSVKPTDTPDSHPTVQWVLRCLSVNSKESYQSTAEELKKLTEHTQETERSTKATELFLFEREFITNRYCMFVFRIIDDRDNELVDYDVLFTAGPKYFEGHLPPGFFVDRQRNQISPGKLTYFIDYDVMAEWLERPEVEGKFGFKIRARPTSGYSFYTVAEHQSTFDKLKQYFEPNQTLMVEVKLKRHVMEGVFQLTNNLVPEPFDDQAKGNELSD